MTFDESYKLWTISELEELWATKHFYEQLAKRQGKPGQCWTQERQEIEAALEWHHEREKAHESA